MNTARNPELTALMDLCTPEGTLLPAARGHTRRPLHHTNLRGGGRNKRWEYWGIITPTHVVGLTLSCLAGAGEEVSTATCERIFANDAARSVWLAILSLLVVLRLPFPCAKPTLRRELPNTVRAALH